MEEYMNFAEELEGSRGKIEDAKTYSRQSRDGEFANDWGGVRGSILQSVNDAGIHLESSLLLLAVDNGLESEIMDRGVLNALYYAGMVENDDFSAIMRVYRLRKVIDHHGNVNYDNLQKMASNDFEDFETAINFLGRQRPEIGIPLGIKEYGR